MSKRFVPDAVNFLRGVYYSASKSDFRPPCNSCIHPFKILDVDSHILEIQENHW